jgi:hypothetical protein
MQFMADLGVETGHYHHSFDGEWFASSPMREFGNGAIWRNNIAYYIDGSEQAANTLKIKLNVNDPSAAREAEDMFVLHSLHLLEQAVSLDAVERLKGLLASLDDFESKHSVWQGDAQTRGFRRRYSRWLLADIQGAARR